MWASAPMDAAEENENRKAKKRNGMTGKEKAGRGRVLLLALLPYSIGAFGDVLCLAG